MKTPKDLVITISILCLIASSCTHDHVAPMDQGERRALLGDIDPHPALDTVCQTADTMYMIREDDFSPVVNKCFNPQQHPIPCPPNQPKWGFLEMQEGYYNDSNYIDCNFTLAPGWYCDFTTWAFGFGNSFTFDQNGIPVIANDWGVQVVNPVENKWTVRVNASTLPNACYDVALRVTAVRLNLYGQIQTASSTRLWGENDNWDIPGHPAQSNSRWLLRFCPMRCKSTPPVDTLRHCKLVYTGITCSGNNMNCTTLNPNITQPGSKTYYWNTGATTPTLNVCPTATTDYTVHVAINGTVRYVVIYEVHVINVACSIPNSGGCGNNGSEVSGVSGSAHHPGCNTNHYYTEGCNGGNHDYGCNTQHSGNTCNHRGHGYHCTTTHATNRACNGGHTRGCDGKHPTSQTCQSRGGHKYNCSGAHTTGNCNTQLYHTTGCSNTSHNVYRGCSNNHAHHGHGNGSGYGSGYNGGHGHTHVCGGDPLPPPPIPGIKICHVPAGNPSGAYTMCVRYNNIDDHMPSVCPGGCNNYGGHSQDYLGPCNANPCL
jgi:hypothetical protein